VEVFIIVTVLWVFSVCIHEFGHALVAYYGGDTSVREKGYLTLNPIHYAHPIYSLLMPVAFVVLGGIGLPGGAVYIEKERLHSKSWETGVSLGGVGMQLPLIFLIVMAFKSGLLQNDPQSVPAVSLGFLLQLEICSIFLNLLPIPPLDGFQAIAPWLPVETRYRFFAMSNYGIMIVFMALWFIRPLNIAFWDLVNFMTMLLGVDPNLGVHGWHAFRFWESGT